MGRCNTSASYWDLGTWQGSIQCRDAGVVGRARCWCRSSWSGDPVGGCAFSGRSRGRVGVGGGGLAGTGAGWLVGRGGWGPGLATSRLVR